MQLITIHRYPLKSCHAQTLISARVGALGIEHDREFMLADANGRFITGREHPSLVSVSVRLDDDGASFSSSEMAELTVSYQQFIDELPSAVFGNPVAALTGCAAADQWFSAYLGIECRLLYISNTPGRRVRSKPPQVPMSFADGYPLLLIGKASLDDLNARLARPVRMANFRPNLVIDTDIAFIEDSWQQVRIGEVLFDLPKRCTRCIFTTVDPDTGIKSADREPLKTLTSYRRLDEGVCFGMNLTAQNQGRLNVGDHLELIS